MAKVDLLTDKKVADMGATKVGSYKRPDGKGLVIWVSPTAKAWRLRFKLDSKERMMSLGQFPDVEVEEARARRDAARKLIAKGIDPVDQRRQERAEKEEADQHTFRRWTKAYFAHNAAKWSEKHQRDVQRILEDLNGGPKDAHGKRRFGLGDKAIRGIEHEDIEKLLGVIEDRNALTYVRDVRLYFRCVVKHYNAKNRKQRITDPSVDIQLKAAPQPKHHVALAPHEIGGFLRALANSNAAPLVRFAVRLLIATALRTGELRGWLWSYIDTKAKLARFPADDMKGRREHLVPLSPQAVALLAELKAELRRIGHGPAPDSFLFPHLFEAGQPISDGTIINAIKYGCGYRGKATAHGMRRTFSTWAHEEGFNSDAIERQLSHAERDQVKAAYNAAEHLPERKRLMSAWADFLEECERGVQITALDSPRKT